MNNGQPIALRILLVLCLFALLAPTTPAQAASRAKKGSAAKTKSGGNQRLGPLLAEPLSKSQQRAQCQNNLRKANRSGC